MNFNNIAIITGDMEGRLLAWNPATGEATRPNGILQKHKIAIAQMACNSKFIYVSAEDQTLNAYTFVDGAFEVVHKEHLKSEGTIKMMHATDKFLYGLTFKGDVIIYNADNLNEIVH